MKFLIAFTSLWATAIASPLGIEGRIRNGVGAFAGEFPYMVYIEMKVGGIYTFTCGGSLISSRWVLTAAHCIDSPRDIDGNIINIYLGVTFTDDAELGYTVWSPNAVRAHPFWERKSVKNDIALIEIPDTVSCTKIKPVPLPPLNPTTPQNYVGESGIASGWGKTSDSSTLSTRLRWGRMRIASNEFCRVLKPWIDDTEICVDTSIDLVSTCIGDSGGPFVLESTGELVAIISHGLGKSCEKGLPLVFTRVTHYLQWIKSITGISY